LVGRNLCEELSRDIVLVDQPVDRLPESIDVLDRRGGQMGSGGYLQTFPGVGRVAHDVVLPA
jgi:hypothetical protein